MKSPYLVAVLATGFFAYGSFGCSSSSSAPLYLGDDSREGVQPAQGYLHTAAKWSVRQEERGAPSSPPRTCRMRSASSDGFLPTESRDIVVEGLSGTGEVLGKFDLESKESSDTRTVSITFTDATGSTTGEFVTNTEEILEITLANLSDAARDWMGHLDSDIKLFIADNPQPYGWLSCLGNALVAAGGIIGGGLGCLAATGSIAVTAGITIPVAGVC